MLRETDVRELLEHTGEMTLSVYLNVNPALQENQASNPAWSIWLKTRLKEIENGLSDEQQSAWEDIRSRLEDYLEDYTPNSKALALFYGPENEQIYELPVPIENQAALGKPLIAPLLWAMDEYEHYLIVLLDNEQARFLSAYLGVPNDEGRANLELDTTDWTEKSIMPATGKGESGTGLTHGRSRDDFEDRVEQQRELFYADVVNRMQSILKQNGVERIVLAGSEQAVHRVHDLMPEAMAKQVIEKVAASMRESPAQVLERVLPIAQEYEREQEMELLQEVINLAKSGGRGALGRKAVEEAVEQGRVELLVVPWPMDDDATALVGRAFAAGSKVELVHGEAAERLKTEGSVAARLYYAL